MSLFQMGGPGIILEKKIFNQPPFFNQWLTLVTKPSFLSNCSLLAELPAAFSSTEIQDAGRQWGSPGWRSKGSTKYPEESKYRLINGKQS